MNSNQRPGLLRTWGGSLAALAFTYAILVVASAFARGHGVPLHGGEFVLINGRSVQPVPQTLGLLYFLLRKLFLVLLLVAVGLSLAVWLTTGSINVTRHLESLPDSGVCLRASLRVAVVLLAVAYAIAAALMFRRPG